MSAYYNEFDPFAAAWLRNLISAGHIAPGEVDERSILDAQPDDLRGFTQCHFFAGIGGWSYALRLAGWPDDRPVWTGSCPCQPFSVAGNANGFADERHLWPFFHYLIEQRRPPVVFGEQVASKDGLAWLDLVHADMEGTGYAFAATDICAAGVGAPHIRQRLWFVGESDRAGRKPRQSSAAPVGHWSAAVATSDAGRMGDDDARLEGLGRGHQAASGRVGALRPVTEAGELGGLEYCACDGRGTGRHDDAGHDGQQLDAARDTAKSGPTNGHWRNADWLYCRDGKWRPVEPGTFPLAHGVPNRVGLLRGYGNAIVPQVAAEVIFAYMECRP